MEEILHQLIGSLSHDFQGFVHPRWCRISSINGMFGKLVETTNLQPPKISQNPVSDCSAIFLVIQRCFVSAGWSRNDPAGFSVFLGLGGVGREMITLAMADRFWQNWQSTETVGFAC